MAQFYEVRPVLRDYVTVKPLYGMSATLGVGTVIQTQIACVR